MSLRGLFTRECAYNRSHPASTWCRTRRCALTRSTKYHQIPRELPSKPRLSEGGDSHAATAWFVSHSTSSRSTAMTGLPSGTNSSSTVPGRAAVLGVAWPDAVKCSLGSSGRPEIAAMIFCARLARSGGRRVGIDERDEGKGCSQLPGASARVKRLRRKKVCSGNAGTCVAFHVVIDASRRVSVPSV